MGNLSCASSIGEKFIHLKKESDPVNISTHKFLKEINDPRFMLLHILQDPNTKHTLFVKEREIDLSFDKLEELKYRSHLSCPYLLNIYGYQLIPCDLKKVSIYFEAFDGDFDQTTRHALLSGARLSEELLWRVLQNVTSALSYLQENSISHQNVTPSQILKVGDNYKLHDNFIICPGTNLVKQGQQNKDLRYLAPEILAALTEKEAASFCFNPYKADVYSLGICLLDAGVLDETEIVIIDRKLTQIIESNLRNRFDCFKSRYSSELSSIVYEMLALEPDRRPDAIQLSKRLPQQEFGFTRNIKAKKIHQGFPSSPLLVNTETKNMVEKVPNSRFAHPSFHFVKNGCEDDETKRMKTIQYGKQSPSRLHSTSALQSIETEGMLRSSPTNDPVLSKFIPKIFPPESVSAGHKSSANSPKLSRKYSTTTTTTPIESTESGWRSSQMIQTKSRRESLENTSTRFHGTESKSHLPAKLDSAFKRVADRTDSKPRMLKDQHSRYSFLNPNDEKTWSSRPQDLQTEDSNISRLINRIAQVRQEQAPDHLTNSGKKTTNYSSDIRMRDPAFLPQRRKDSLPLFATPSKSANIVNTHTTPLESSEDTEISIQLRRYETSELNPTKRDRKAEENITDHKEKLSTSPSSKGRNVLASLDSQLVLQPKVASPISVRRTYGTKSSSKENLELTIKERNNITNLSVNEKIANLQKQMKGIGNEELTQLVADIKKEYRHHLNGESNKMGYTSHDNKIFSSQNNICETIPETRREILDSFEDSRF